MFLSGKGLLVLTTEPTGLHAPTRDDLTEDAIPPLLVDFYDTIAADPLLAPYFAHVDMREHIPRIADFWSTIIFHSGRYSGNAFRPHLAMPGLTGAHFARWVSTLERTVNARVLGPRAEAMKALGHRIAFSMQVRLGLQPFEPYPSAEAFAGAVPLGRKEP